MSNTSISEYVRNLERAYASGTNDHQHHNDNPDYWDILLNPIKRNPTLWEGRFALDFGCGKGRNVANLKSLAKWARVDGVDISSANIQHCKTEQPDSRFFNNSGSDLREIRDSIYDYAMSTIVFQHICVHSVRSVLFREICRVMKDGAIFSLQMGFGPRPSSGESCVSYTEDAAGKTESNGAFDVRISSPQEIEKDLTEAGFSVVRYDIRPSFADSQHPQWIYLECCK